MYYYASNLLALHWALSSCSMVCAKIQGAAEEAVIQVYPAAAHFEFQGYHAAPLGLGKFLLYRRQAPASPFPAYGYIPVRQNFLEQWRVGNGGKCSSADTMPPTSLVTFHAHFLWLTYGYNEMSSYSVVCGHTDSSQVQAVAVRWQDGTITQDQVEHGWFMLVKPERQAACHLQLLDQANTVIHTMDPAQIDFTSTDATTPLPPCAVAH